jgi:phenylacetic acid degradation protein paaN
MGEEEGRMSTTAITAPVTTLFEKHALTLQRALSAIRERTYWSAYAEVPSSKTYGENAKSEGEAAFQSYLNATFPLDTTSSVSTVGDERSPYGFPLGVHYPKHDIPRLIEAAQAALVPWRRIPVQERVGIALEALSRLNVRSFEIAFAAMHTTGQGFTMAFQAAGPNAQDRALEAVAYAYDEMSRVPEHVVWEKPQGKNSPMRLKKCYRIVPRGIALVIGCSTFPTWNAYPGLFASFVTGNAVIVKPHPGAILPLAITVRVIREVLDAFGVPPDVVQLAADEANASITKELALRPEIAIIDYTGSSVFGGWLEREARDAVVYTEKSGVNSVILDSTDDLEGMLRNLAFSLSLYSGQMCTTPQNIFLPSDGIMVKGERVAFDDITAGLVAAVKGLLDDNARAVEILGALQNDATATRLEEAARMGDIVSASRSLLDVRYPQARIRTPLLLKTDASNSACEREQFGPITFLVRTKDTEESIACAARLAREHGAITGAIYSTNHAVLERARDVAADAGIPLSCNLFGNVYVNQTAAFSDYHMSGLNPAGNAVLVDAAFVAARFRVAASREPIG